MSLSVPEASSVLDTSPKHPAHNTGSTKPLRIFFRYTGLGNNYGKLAIVDSSISGSTNFSAGLACEVVHYAAGYGICLTADRGVFTTYAAKIFNADFQTLFTIPIKGVPAVVVFRQTDEWPHLPSL